jgi:hypothetical protein
MAACVTSGVSVMSVGSSPVRARAVVEHNAAAAVDLQVDETRCQQAAVEHPALGMRGHVPHRHHVADSAVQDEHGSLVEDPVPVEDAGADDGGEGHQCVSVTLRRCGGLSGSKPRSRLTFSISR